MGRKQAHFKPYWAYIGTGKSKSNSSPAGSFVTFILVVAFFVIVFISKLIGG